MSRPDLYLCEFRVAFRSLGRTKGLANIVVLTLVLLAAAVVASMVPAARAARVDVMQALRSD
jgi:ABC-type lipoprotein release transport system permease subunit